MFEEFIKKFEQTLEDCLEEFCERHNLYYDYSYKKVYNWCKFDVTLWYGDENYNIYYSIHMDFILEETDKGIVIKAKVKDKPAKLISRRKTCQRMDKLKTSILKTMEELLSDNLKELKIKIGIYEYIRKIKEIVGQYDCWKESNWDKPIVHVEIIRSKLVIYSVKINSDFSYKLYPDRVVIDFKREDECKAFSSFIEDKIEGIITLPTPNKVNIDLAIVEYEKRFEVIKKIIEALEILYLI